MVATPPNQSNPEPHGWAALLVERLFTAARIGTLRERVFIVLVLVCITLIMQSSTGLLLAIKS
jgi:hypothetical protein